ncbi:hypothetical protein AWB91_27230 [Mycobacterium paraense]|uniref:Uncharacterized protein n=1 Tax=Mycobacterium paraense TaxID=767916 RepID=A0ABX3VGK0_9MYCO|nr:hypothetical protein AWB91_27230 [Mycobacterium paraense]ORW39346.1 hypothetical protein AWB88_16225 [Mycobacterium paraense]
MIASNRELRQAIDLFRVSAEMSSKRLERVTWLLVVLTVVLVVLTVVLMVEALPDEAVDRVRDAALTLPNEVAEFLWG